MWKRCHQHAPMSFWKLRHLTFPLGYSTLYEATPLEQQAHVALRAFQQAFTRATCYIQKVSFLPSLQLPFLISTVQICAFGVLTQQIFGTRCSSTA